ncbi:6056_t:CDS:2, partial [Gigaspora rosea]
MKKKSTTTEREGFIHKKIKATNEIYNGTNDADSNKKKSVSSMKKNEREPEKNVKHRRKPRMLS